MRLASIDIGSNAIRFQVVTTHEGKTGGTVFKKIDYMRFPLRLGTDVFNAGKILRPTEEKFVKLMRVFATLLDLYEVNDYIACATSAMREASNGKEIVERVYYKDGLRVDIIDGSIEAQMISLALGKYIPMGNVIHIDVGGGSTELNLYRHKTKVASRSFKMGSVRKLNKEERTNMFDIIRHWYEQSSAPYFNREEEVIAIGTGGNINKLFNLSKQKKSEDKITYLSELRKIRAWLEEFTFEERVKKLRLNEDRADVIIPAARIYTNVMDIAGAEKIIVPGVGLKDGVLHYLMKERGYKPNQ
ncbi:MULTISPECIES: Ppx/GppA phosphatase family protein [Flammeovirga]|uniref:Phosphatase n=1 Tax=Flammeovirga agarivorans TaxID=2726742 RepID=A0A7X8XV23_9BACT|nr:MULTISPECIES: phosphatase [Flammeovirga]NLR90947.1 phosphatase [Flammeovirga agarivorans]